MSAGEGRSAPNIFENRDGSKQPQAEQIINRFGIEQR